MHPALSRTSSLIYIETGDIAASLKDVENASGKTIVPLVAIPSGTSARFADVEGNTVGAWQPKPGS